jgi:hypothetical protein
MSVEALQVSWNRKIKTIQNAFIPGRMGFSQSKLRVPAGADLLRIWINFIGLAPGACLPSVALKAKEGCLEPIFLLKVIISWTSPSYYLTQSLLKNFRIRAFIISG